jgi:hypothetical protein
MLVDAAAERTIFSQTALSLADKQEPGDGKWQFHYCFQALPIEFQPRHSDYMPFQKLPVFRGFQQQ